MTPPLVAVHALSKRFRARDPAAVDAVSFTVPRGETLALVGESGSGKTTLARAMLRLIEPTAGRVTFDGLEVRSLAPVALRRLRRRMQMIFQDPFAALNPRLRIGGAVREPIEVHGLARGAAAEERANALLEEVGLDRRLGGSLPSELSGGQRQRAVIARALSVEPEFLALDEPLSSLDASVAAQVLNLLADLQQRHGLTYLFISHELATVRLVAHRVAVMYCGRIVELGPTAATYQQPLHPYTAALLSAVPVPDPARQRQRIVLPDEPPGGRRPAGCAFHPRCPHPRKSERCRTERPELRELTAGRGAACHYAEDPMPLTLAQ
mgnify:CR=1 FL=1